MCEYVLYILFDARISMNLTSVPIQVLQVCRPLARVIVGEIPFRTQMFLYYPANNILMLTKCQERVSELGPIDGMWVAHFQNLFKTIS